MRQIGIIREVTDGFAVVEVSRKSACEGCHAASDGECSACVSFGDKITTAKADNSVGAKVGDRVILETDSRTVILYAAAVFLFPLLLGIAGYFALGALDFAAAPYIGALCGFALAFVIVWLTLNRAATKRCDIKIVRIL